MFEIQSSHFGVLTWAASGTKRKVWLVRQVSSGSPSQHTMHAFDCLTWIWRIFLTSMILKFPYLLSYVSLFQWICIYILWRLHRTWKLSCLPTFKIFYFQTLKYVQLKFFHYVWRRISGHLKNNYKFLLGVFSLFPLSHEFTTIFLLLFISVASFCFNMAEYIYTHKFTFTLF